MRYVHHLGSYCTGLIFELFISNQVSNAVGRVDLLGCFNEVFCLVRAGLGHDSTVDGRERKYDAGLIVSLHLTYRESDLDTARDNFLHSF